MVDGKKPGPDWANGCDKCRMGIVSEPSQALFNLAMPHYLVRAYQWKYGLLTLCTCRAGLLYLQFCRKRWREIEATSAKAKSGIPTSQLGAREELVPDGWHDAMMDAIRTAQEQEAEEDFPVPTMHWEPTV